MKRYLNIVSFLVAATSLFAAVRVVTTAITFTYTDPNAATVEVAGEFNDWKPQAMTKDESGNWSTTVNLEPGQYGYKFVVDGEWKFDPKNPSRKRVNDTENSSMTIGTASAEKPAAGAGETSTKSTFTFTDPHAKTVFVAGPFNNWDPTANPLKKNEAGLWSTTIALKPGKQLYKFVVDGDWRVDPKNPDSEDDGSGNLNSIKTVAP
jgi:1,4-alpha-glucan branching enzyme